MALVGNLRLWTVQELVSSVLLCNHKSIQDETVRKVCENFQYLDMGIFAHILSGRTGRRWPAQGIYRLPFNNKWMKC